MIAMAIISGMILNAQDRNDVIKAYNDGAKASSTDPVAAIAAFESTISLADKVGETAADLKQKAEKVLPGLYVKVALKALNEKKPAAEVIRSAKAAGDVAAKYSNTTSKDNANNILVAGYGSLAGGYFSAGDYSNALLTFDSLLAINPNFVSAIYNKALIYAKQGDSQSLETTVDSYVEKLKATPGSDDKIKQANTMALEYFKAAGSQSLKKEKVDDALALLGKSSKYGDDKDLFYYFADAYNRKKEFDKGAEYAQKGLDLETGDATAKAKFYFQLAEAQFGKGMKAEACASYKNASFGPFAEPSKIQRKNLKCEDAK